MTFERLERKPLSATVQKAIKDYIISSGLQPGDFLPTEKSLEEELKISRTALRESLKSLEALGIIGVKHGVGRYLRQFQFAELLDTLSFNISLNTKSFADVIELRKALESRFLRQAVESGDLDIRELHNLLDKLYTEVRRNSDPDRIRDLHGEFHLSLYHNIDNSLLKDLIKVFVTIQRFVDTTYNHVVRDHEGFIHCHRRIVDAIDQRDPDLAEERLLEHFSEVEEWIEQIKHTIHGRETDQSPGGPDADSAVDSVGYDH